MAKFWPDFDPKDSGFFTRKNKFIPKLPSSINDLTDLPQKFKESVTGARFLASPVSLFLYYLMMISLISLQILADSTNGGMMVHLRPLQNFTISII